MSRPGRTGRQRWTWCAEARNEFEDLKKADRLLLPMLAARLKSLTAKARGRPGLAAMGRARQLSVFTDVTYCLLFVERHDGQGLGGLHLCIADSSTLRCHGAACDLALYRLSEQRRW